MAPSICRTRDPPSGHLTVRVPLPRGMRATFPTTYKGRSISRLRQLTASMLSRSTRVASPNDWNAPRLTEAPTTCFDTFCSEVRDCIPGLYLQDLYSSRVQSCVVEMYKSNTEQSRLQRPLHPSNSQIPLQLLTSLTLEPKWANPSPSTVKKSSRRPPSRSSNPSL